MTFAVLVEDNVSEQKQIKQQDIVFVEGAEGAIIICQSDYILVDICTCHVPPQGVSLRNRQIPEVSRVSPHSK